MRISLINVQFHEGNNMFPPLGLLYVAGALRDAGHRVQLLDGDPLLETDMVDRVADFDPDLIGLSSLTMTIGRAALLARQLAARLPAVPLMVGGPHATAEPADTLRELGAAVVVVGEGERTAVEVAERYASRAQPDGVPGTVTAQTTAPPRPFIEDMDSLPLPARDLCDFERYLSPPGLIRGWASGRHASLMAGRGCRYRCTFCASHLQLGRTLRMRSVPHVLAELDHLVERYGVRGVYWTDDIFTGDKAWVRELCLALAARPYRLEWACQSRVESVDRLSLGLMKAAGCVQIDFGVESGSKKVLRAMKKGTTYDRVVQAFELVHEMGMRTGASFIIGSPGEELDDIEVTLELARRIASDWTVFFYSTPYPGTDLWRELHAGGWDQSFPPYGESWSNRQRQTPFHQGSLHPDELAEWRLAAQNQHFRRNYLHRRNLGYALRLARVAVAQPALLRTAVEVAVRGGRLDDAVEAWFAADRARVTLRRRLTPVDVAPGGALVAPVGLPPEPPVPWPSAAQGSSS